MYYTEGYEEKEREDKEHICRDRRTKEEFTQNSKSHVTHACTHIKTHTQLRAADLYDAYFPTVLSVLQMLRKNIAMLCTCIHDKSSASTLLSLSLHPVSHRHICTPLIFCVPSQTQRIVLFAWANCLWVADNDLNSAHIDYYIKCLRPESVARCTATPCRTDTNTRANIDTHAYIHTYTHTCVRAFMYKTHFGHASFSLSARVCACAYLILLKEFVSFSAIINAYSCTEWTRTSAYAHTHTHTNEQYISSTNQSVSEVIFRHDCISSF